MWRLPVFMEGGKYFMSLMALFDSIRTGFGCLLADVRCMSAEKKAKHCGIDTDVIKEHMYGQLGSCMHESDPKIVETKDKSMN